MTTAVLTSVVISFVAGATVGIIVKHIQDTKVIRRIEKNSEITIKKLSRSLTHEHNRTYDALFDRIERLEKENKALKNNDFFQDIPTEIDTSFDINYLMETV